VKEDLVLVIPCDLRTSPGKQAEDYRVFQALALVHGDDPHGVVVPLQAQLVFLRRLTLGGHSLGEPLLQAADAEPALRLGLVQDFPQMKNIGEPPLAVRERQQSLPHLVPVQPLAEHTEKAVSAPQLGVLVEKLEPFLPPRLAAFRQLRGVYAEEICD